MAIHDPFKSCREDEWLPIIDPYTTDWEQLDPTFRGLPERLGYVDLESDENLACDIYCENSDRIYEALRKIREPDIILIEMSAYVYRLYMDRGIFQPLLRDVNQDRCILCMPKLVRLHDGLVRANEIKLLERLWRSQTRLEVSWIVNDWREQEIYRKEYPDIQSGEDLHSERNEELASGWFEHAIRLFASLGEPEMGEWFAAERESLVSRSFLKPKDLPKAIKRTIDEEAFWEILAEVYAETEGDVSLRQQALASRLERLTGPAIRTFAKRYEKVKRSMAHHDVTALLVFAYDTDSSDVYFDFCEEVIWRGDRELVEGLVSRPLEVAARLPSIDEVLLTDPVSQAIDEASVARTGLTINWSDAMQRWRGRGWVLQKINDRYPELAAHFGPVTVE